MYPKSRYAAEGVCFECHVLAWQYALHESVELSAGFDSWSRALAGADHGAQGGGDRCVFGIERMYIDHVGSSILAVELGAGCVAVQIGYWRCPLCELIQMTSLKSSRLRGPVRPQPLSRTPPMGAWISSLTVGEFTFTIPARTFGAISNAL